MAQENNTRIYGKAEDIDSTSIMNFWNAKAKKDSSLKAVLLGSDFAENSGILRNERENQILQKFLAPPPPHQIKKSLLSILDIGCGIGRWAYNMQYIFTTYHGIDFSREFIRNASNSFKDDNRVRFFNMSATNIDISLLADKYDLIIITGVAMYINDGEIEKLFNYCNKLGSQTSSIYFQESVSILPNRLTLKDFESVELKSKYNAIYRTKEEYENYFTNYLPDYSIDNNKTALLLDKDTGAREETNARYWFLKRKKI
jgi:SAM-dependent methyltransferase